MACEGVNYSRIKKTLQEQGFLKGEFRLFFNYQSPSSDKRGVQMPQSEARYPW